MNKKGQALVEFVLILPILIFILLSIVDIGKIMIMKNHLESLLTGINLETTEVEDLEYDIRFNRQEENNKVIVELETCYDVITPGLNKIIGDPACVKTSKIIEKE